MQQQHMTLSSMADQNASMLLAVTSVMLALVVRNGTLVNLKNGATESLRAKPAEAA
jgi:hypothetical protein